MRKKILIAFLLLTGCILISNNAFAAWTQAKGHMYNQLTVSLYTSDEKYTEYEFGTGLEIDNSKQPAAKFESTNITYYGAYGITDKITVSLTVPYLSIWSADVNEQGNEVSPAIGDITVGLRYNVSQNIFAGILMSVDAKVKIPEAYDCETPLQNQNLGDCQYDTQLSLVFGKGFSWGYGILDLGYKYRFENTDWGQYKPADVLVMRIDAGHGLSKNLWLRGSFSWSEALDNAEVSDDFIFRAGHEFGGFDESTDKDKIIKDSLGIESDTLSLGVALAYTMNSQVSMVFGYETTARGWGHFKSKNAGIGQTYSLAGVYSF